MIAGRDTETGPEVVDDGPEGSLPLERCPEGSDAATDGDSDDEGNLKCYVSKHCVLRGHNSRLTLSQLTCLYQLDFVMGVSVMCGFLGSYLGLRLGSEVLAIEEGCLT